jgi:hypothetical protein
MVTPRAAQRPRRSKSGAAKPRGRRHRDDTGAPRLRRPPEVRTIAPRARSQGLVSGPACVRGGFACRGRRSGGPRCPGASAVPRRCRGRTATDECGAGHRPGSASDAGRRGRPNSRIRLPPKLGQGGRKKGDQVSGGAMQTQEVPGGPSPRGKAQRGPRLQKVSIRDLPGRDAGHAGGLGSEYWIVEVQHVVVGGAGTAAGRA